MKTLFLSLLMTALCTSPAHAVFTTAEATQIENIRVNVVGKLALALESDTFAIQGNQDTLAMRRSAILQTNFAMQHALRGLSRLVDVVEPAQFIVPDPATRANRVAAAWGDFDQSVTYIDGAISALSGATGTNMVQARTTHLPGARNAILAVNRNLSYADARPTSYPRLIGPHGDYDRMQAQLARSWNYHVDIVYGAFNVYGQGANPPVRNWYTALQKSFQNYKTLADGHALMAGVGQTNISQFWRVLNYLRRLTDSGVDGLNVRFFNILAALADPNDPLYFAVTRVGESWRASDQAAWEEMVFPDCSQATDPDGCAAGQVGQ